MSVDEREPIPLEERRLRGVGAQRLALEHELGDPADQVFDAGKGVEPQRSCVHAVSLYRLNQELVKHWKKFSEPTQKLLG